MKSLPNNKIYAILIVLITALPIACKKEANDPNIDDRTINKTFTAIASDDNFIIEDSIDTDLDGIFDIIFTAFIGDSSQASTSFVRNGGLLIENKTILGDVYPLNKNLATGDLLDVNSLTWNNSAFSSLKTIIVNNTADDGIHGKGDKYFGFRIKKSTGNYLYGWLKVNLSDDFKTFTIKELAVQKVINKAIKVGEK